MGEQIFTLKTELGTEKYVHGVVPVISIMIVLVGHRAFIIITLYKCDILESNSIIFFLFNCLFYLYFTTELSHNIFNRLFINISIYNVYNNKNNSRFNHDNYSFSMVCHAIRVNIWLGSITSTDLRCYAITSLSLLSLLNDFDKALPLLLDQTTLPLYSPIHRLNLLLPILKTNLTGYIDGLLDNYCSSYKATFLSYEKISRDAIRT